VVMLLALVLALAQWGFSAEAPALGLGPRNLHAVILSTSQFWFNYRHSTNALLIYHQLRRSGLPDANIVLMLADDYACDPRNAARGQIYGNYNHADELNRGVHVDYRGADVTPDNFLNVLSGRHPTGTAASKQLRTDATSDVLVYMTGHGGDEFMKFRDTDEMTANDLALAIQEMRRGQRYNRMLLIADTCEADTLGNYLQVNSTPEVAFVGSSLKSENSYSHHADEKTGVLVVDRFTHHLLSHLNRQQVDSESLQVLFGKVGREPLLAHVGYKSTLTNVGGTSTLPASLFFRAPPIAMTLLPAPAEVASPSPLRPNTTTLFVSDTAVSCSSYMDLCRLFGSR
jgi:phosphatidylinositol glycan class K